MTQDDINNVDLHLVGGTTTIVCSLVLKDGTVIVGHAHGENPAASLQEVMQAARADADSKLTATAEGAKQCQ